MQRFLNPNSVSSKPSNHLQTPIQTTLRKLTLIACTAGVLSLTGCQTIKNIASGSDDEAIAVAVKTEFEYYEDAIESLDKGHYLDANEQLTELRTFYPTGRYAQQALLDLMYSQFQSKEYESAATSAEQFIKLYPRHVQIDYAYYVRGVANMQAGNSTLLNWSQLKQAHRDTAYLRLAFSNFLELILRYPNSSYAPDAAERMSYIYNQFAESEMHVARWYVEREAYVAAVNRAKWVFQYFPLSPQIPESIATLAYSYDQLGMDDLAQEYKTLLKINYPEWLTRSGDVNISKSGKGVSGLVNKVSFGLLGRSDDNQDSGNFDASGEYMGATKQQRIITRASQLQLPESQATIPSQADMPAFNGNARSGINLGLGLPEQDAENIRDISSPTATAISIKDSPQQMYPETVPARQTTPDLDSNATGVNVPVDPIQISPNVADE